MYRLSLSPLLFKVAIGCPYMTVQYCKLIIHKPNKFDTIITWQMLFFVKKILILEL